MADLTSYDAKLVEVTIREDGSSLWIMVDGECRFRAARVKEVKIYDQRKKHADEELDEKK